MDPESATEVRKAFFCISKGSKEINQSQLENLFYTLGFKPLPSPPYIAEIQAAFDKNAKLVTFEALLEKLNEMMTVKSTEIELKEALTVFDESGNGKITKSELRRALTAYSKLPKNEIDSLLNAGQSGEFIDSNELLGKLSKKYA